MCLSRLSHIPGQNQFLKSTTKFLSNMESEDRFSPWVGIDTHIRQNEFCLSGVLCATLIYAGDWTCVNG